MSAPVITAESNIDHCVIIEQDSTSPRNLLKAIYEYKLHHGMILAGPIQVMKSIHVSGEYHYTATLVKP